MSFSVFPAGFSLGISLILAIGAQNAFVLKQGLKQQHVFVVCLICALSDAILITLGVAGFGVVVQKYPFNERMARYLGAAFLFFYSALSF
jgi:L-lysine exporter family protein LysE/ArgO